METQQLSSPVYSNPTKANPVAFCEVKELGIGECSWWLGLRLPLSTRTSRCRLGSSTPAHGKYRFDLLYCFLLQLYALILCLCRFCQLYNGAFKLPQKTSHQDVRECLSSELEEENSNSFCPALP